jgi:hypothetical protein
LQRAVFIPGLNEDCQLTLELSNLDLTKGKVGGEELVSELVTLLRTYVLLEENGFAIDGHPAVFGRSNRVAANL